MNQFNQEFKPCRYCGKEGSDNHHLLKRSTNPELIDDPKNLVFLCRSCHMRTENENDFLKALQDIFYNWKTINLDLYLRAEASIEALLKGEIIEYNSPAIVSHYLILAGSKFSYFSERLTECEKEYAPFFMARTKEISNEAIKMEWQCTEKGQEMIEAKMKMKSLEKIQSNLRAYLRRMEVEYFNSK